MASGRSARVAMSLSDIDRCCSSNALSIASARLVTLVPPCRLLPAIVLCFHPVGVDASHIIPPSPDEQGAPPHGGDLAQPPKAGWSGLPDPPERVVALASIGSKIHSAYAPGPTCSVELPIVSV